MKDYSAKSDEELIRLLRDGNPEVTDYLMEKYKHLVRGKANALFLMGGDTDDLIQEGMIGLFKAIRDFDPEKDVSFRHFAELCVTRQLYTAIEANNRKKHAPLNTYVSIDEGTDGTEPLEEMLHSLREMNPEELLIREEDIRDRLRIADELLSPMEKRVLSLYLTGLGYVQIAEVLGKPPKSVDNTIQRIRKKLTESTAS